ncbi:MAG: PASTA domain-containing protein [Bacteroidetes bacterium]|nr:PASTA domain-containing protein [Bacteroidota bacterium]
MLTATNGNGATPARTRPPRDARRLYVPAALLLVALLVIAGRLVKLQIVDRGMYAEQARRQYESKVALQAERGVLYDRNGNLLAANTTSISFAADPNHIENPRKLAKAFSTAFGEPYDDWLRKLTTRGTSFIWLRRKVSGQQLESLKDLEDNGLIKLKEPLRHFEYASLGAQALGSTDVDNNGLNGVELFYNQQLRGTDGFIVMQRDARGHRRPDVDLPQSPPEHGDGLVLTLDINLQGIVEDELKKGVDRAGAASGTAIAIDPRTGEILAIASYPTYDPNDLRHADQSALRIRAITDMYEPGSTMKIVTAAAALEDHAVTPNSTFDGQGGEYQLGPHTIRDDHPAGMMTMREAMEHSSNIAFAKIASRLPAPRFYKYVRDFGFGIVSGVDLPGEARGQVKKPDEFVEGTQQFMAFGYQLAVTPLQLVSAYAAVANHGVMMKPHLLKRRLNRDGEVIEEIQPQEIRHVVSRETADTVREMLVGVVERGTGTEARVEGLRIAGKTGTSQQLANGEYSKSKYNASFVGFFPADDPKITLLVLLDSPSNGYYGGQVAAPIFREIARRIAGVANARDGSEPAVEAGLNGPAQQGAPAQQAVPAAQTVSDHGRIQVPDLRGVDAESARHIGEKYGCRMLVRGTGRLVTSQLPAAGSTMVSHGVLMLVLSNPAERGLMPDVRGMSIRRALNVLNAVGVTPAISGSGIVRSQSPAPNVPLAAGVRNAQLLCR